MVIDAHYHLDERVQPIEGLLEQMDRSGVEQIALIPCMNEPIFWNKLIDRASGLVRIALTGRGRPFGMRFYENMVTPDGKFIVFGRNHAIYDQPDHEPVAGALRRYPDRFFGWVFVNPSQCDPIPMLEKWSREPGWIGAKSHPFMHRYPVAQLDDVAAWCSERGWPLLVHLGADPERGNFRWLPERHPDLKILFAHAGVPFFQELWDFARGKENLYVDLSSPAYVDRRIMLGAVRALGAEKCLFGSDGPYCGVDHAKMVQTTLGLPLSAKEHEQILCQNFLDLVGIPA